MSFTCKTRLLTIKLDSQGQAIVDGTWYHLPQALRLETKAEEPIPPLMLLLDKENTDQLQSQLLVEVSKPLGDDPGENINLSPFESNQMEVEIEEWFVPEDDEMSFKAAF